MKTLGNEVDRQEVLRRVAALRPDSTRKWGKMTCHQMMCHLTDSFLLSIGERQGSAVRLPLPQGIAKWGALSFPLRWPKNMPTLPEVEQGGRGTPPVGFEEDRQKLVAIIARFCGSKNEWAQHPMFGKMTEQDWRRWGYLHCDHHLRQFGS